MLAEAFSLGATLLKPTRVILHCSDTPDKGDRFDIDDVRRWHIEERGFSDVGYHWFIKRDGLLQSGRPPDQMGAHCKGENDDSIGICYSGTAKPTGQQVKTLLALYAHLWKTHGIDWRNWFGHYEFNQYKSCPGISMVVFRNLLRLQHGILEKKE